MSDIEDLVEESNDEKLLDRTVKEIYKIENRIIRYKNKLLKTALTKLKEKGKERLHLCRLIVASDMEEDTLYVHKKTNEAVNIDELIDIAGQELPSLKRRYEREVQRYDKLWEQMETLYNKLKSKNDQ